MLLSELDIFNPYPKPHLGDRLLHSNLNSQFIPIYYSQSYPQPSLYLHLFSHRYYKFNLQLQVAFLFIVKQMLII